MSNPTSVELLIQQALQYLENNSYSDSSIRRYHKCWKELLEVCQLKNISCFCYEQCLPLMLEKWEINISDSVSPFQRFQIRSLKCLRDFQHKGIFLKQYRDERAPTPLFNPKLLSSYLDHLAGKGLKASTILRKKHTVSHFLLYLTEQGISNISSLSPQLILQYLNYLEKCQLSPSTKGLYLNTIKTYLEFLFDRQDISIPLYRMVAGNSFTKYVKLPSRYSQEELKSILSVVDRSSIMGRRDYLVMLLTMQLGIRTGDLCRIKLDDIYWETESIRFIQQKTGNLQTLPMPENIKYALLDYLKNSRPQTSSSYVFIRLSAPYTPYIDTNPFHYTIKKYMDLAGIDYSGRKHGLHAMRHSLAGNLLEDGVDFPVISGILGHISTETTMRYAGIDISALRRIALEVPYEG